MLQRSRVLSLIVLLFVLAGCAAPAAPPAPRPVSAPGLPSAPYGYDTPVQPDAPWPLFRRDRRNTGASPLPADYRGDQPWSFRTGKGIFSTPVIDAAGNIYVGSADHVFYALSPDGGVKWTYPTGEIIDSAAALARSGLIGPDTAVVIPSGDGYLHAVRMSDRAPIWQFDANTAQRDSYNNWWEGNVGIGFDGTLYAGNTNFNYYAVTPEGVLDWVYETGANAWSIAGIGDDGTLFWGSNDTFVHAVDPAGQGLWTKRTLGFIAASSAVGMDGMLYIGSFDSYLYALDPATGKTRWRFKTTDHIYASVALGESADGTRTVYLASTDGILYALDAVTGALRWTFDAGDPIRSSPVIGAGPTDEGGAIVYFGAGNGKLYALDAATGGRRWSFDTTPADPELRDRNDLNGSPALGLTGIAISGETGDVWYVPYDYCLHAQDERCAVAPGEDLPADTIGFYYVTPGGTTQMTGAPTVTPGTILTLRLVAREGDETTDAWVCNRPVGCPEDALVVTADPPFPFRVEKSADGKYLHIIPDGFLEPRQDYTLDISAQTYAGGAALGNLQLGGRAGERVEQDFTFSVTPPGEAFPLAIGPDRVDAIEWTRLAAPIPPMMPSLNQIGFDYLDWIIAPVALGEPDETGAAPAVLWAVGATRDTEGVLHVDPLSDFTLPLAGKVRGDDFILENRDFTMEVTGIPIPFNLLQMRGRLGADGRVAPGASLIADTDALSIPTFGPYLVIAGLANDWYKKLLVAGTFITRPYDDEGGANIRPEGVALAGLTLEAPTGETAGRVVATLTRSGDAAYQFAAHRPAILLVDAESDEPVWLDYHANLKTTASGDGATVELTLPAGTVLPDQTDAIVILDVFPLARRGLDHEGAERQEHEGAK